MNIAEKAFEYNDYLVSFAYRYVRNYEDARDYVQQTYLNLMTYNSLDEIDEKQFCGYLRKAVIHAIMDKRKNGWSEIEVKEKHAVTTHSTSKEDMEFADEVLAIALKELPTKVQKTLRYYFKEGCNAKMICTRMGGTEAAVGACLRKYVPIVTKKMGMLAKTYV